MIPNEKLPRQSRTFVIWWKVNGFRCLNLPVLRSRKYFFRLRLRLRGKYFFRLQLQITFFSFLTWVGTSTILSYMDWSMLHPSKIKIVVIYKHFFSNHDFSIYNFFKSLINRKEPEPEPKPQFVFSALSPAPGGNLTSALHSGSATLEFTPSHWGRLSQYLILIWIRIRIQEGKNDPQN